MPNTLHEDMKNQPALEMVKVEGTDDFWLFKDAYGNVWRVRYTYNPQMPFIYEILRKV